MEIYEPVLLMRCLLAAVFAAAAIAKLRSGDTRASAVELGLPRVIVRFSPLLPAFEFALAVGLVLPWFGPTASWASLGILGVFTIILGRVIAAGTGVTCGCFGSETRPVGWRHVIRNSGMAALAAISLGGSDIAFAAVVWMAWAMACAVGFGALQIARPRVRTNVLDLLGRSGVVANSGDIIVITRDGCPPCQRLLHEIENHLDDVHRQRLVIILGGRHPDGPSPVAGAVRTLMVDENDWSGLNIVRTPAAARLPRRGAFFSSPVSGLEAVRRLVGLPSPTGPPEFGRRGVLKTAEHIVAAVGVTALGLMSARGPEALARAGTARPRDPNHRIGTCKDLSDYSSATGVTASDGNHPGLDGWTIGEFVAPKRSHLPLVSGGPVYACPCEMDKDTFPTYPTLSDCEAVAPCRPGLGGCLVKCGGAVCYTLVNYDAGWAYTPHTRKLSWSPPGGERSVSAACRRDIARWNRAIDTHEQHHVDDGTSITKDLAKKRYNITKCAADDSTAQQRVADELERQLQADSDSWQAKWVQMRDAFHATPEGGPIPSLDCKVCGP